MNGSMAAIAASSAAAAQKELAAPGHSFDQLPDVLGSPNLVAPDRELVRRAMIWEIEGAASHTKERIRKSNFGATPVSDAVSLTRCADLALGQHQKIVHPEPSVAGDSIGFTRTESSLRSPTPPVQRPQRILDQYWRSGAMNRAAVVVQAAVDVLQEVPRGKLEDSLRSRGLWQQTAAIKRNIKQMGKGSTNSAWEQVSGLYLTGEG